MGQELQGYEVMLHLPNNVRQKDENRNSNADPKPAAAQEMTSRREEQRGNDAESEKARGVTRLHAKAQNNADGRPATWVFRLQQANKKIGNSDAPEIVERDVLEHCALYKRNGRDSCGHRSEDLDMATSTEFLGHQPGQHHDEAHSHRREDTQTDERSPQED